MSDALFSVCGLKFIVNENDRRSIVLLGQHTAQVFIESCMTSELILFSGDVDNTLNVYLLKVVRLLNWYSFQVMWTTHCTCIY